MVTIGPFGVDDLKDWVTMMKTDVNGSPLWRTKGFLWVYHTPVEVGRVENMGLPGMDGTEDAVIRTKLDLTRPSVSRPKGYFVCLSSNPD